MAQVSVKALWGSQEERVTYKDTNYKELTCTVMEKGRPQCTSCKLTIQEGKVL